MGSPLGGAAALSLLSILATSCTTVDAARDASVKYNSAFADARNEILLINILRARDQVPLEFSTISTVTGPMRANVDVTSAFEWIFHDNDKLTPGGTLTFRNPAVTLTPLESKEFLQGMAKPLTAEAVDELQALGSDRAAVLNLAIAGVVCSGTESKYGNATVLNNGRDSRVVADFERIAAASADWDLTERKPKPIAHIAVKAPEGAKLVKEGLGDDYSVELADEQASASDMRVSVKSTEKEIIGLQLGDLCPTHSPHTLVAADRDGDDESNSQKIFFRSPAAMIAYLGQLMNVDPMSPFFRVEYAESVSRMPPTAPVRAIFGRYAYYIPSAREGGATTLQTFGILNQIIALQTTQATLDKSKPTLTVGTE